MTIDQHGGLQLRQDSFHVGLNGCQVVGEVGTNATIALVNIVLQVARPDIERALTRAGVKGGGKPGPYNTRSTTRVVYCRGRACPRPGF